MYQTSRWKSRPYNIRNSQFKQHCADLSQGNQSKFCDNAGKFVAMSLTAIIFKYTWDIYNWNSPDLNNMLFHSNYLHSCIKGSVNTAFLLLTDVPIIVSINDKTYDGEH